MSINEQTGLWNSIEAAQFLGIKPNTMRVWRRDGRVPYIEVAPRLYRYDPLALQRWLSARTRDEQR